MAHGAKHLTLFALFAVLGTACGGGGGPGAGGDAAVADVGVDASTDARVDSSVDSGVFIPDDAFTILTFNGGTTLGLPHDSGEDTGTGDGYTQADAVAADALYHNSLSWNPAEAALTVWIAEQNPAIAAFQEIFWDGWCPEIMADTSFDSARDFVCKDYAADRPLQMERVMGPSYQIVCTRDKEDNCLAVRRDFGTVRDCPGPGTCFDPAPTFGTPCSRRPHLTAAVVDLASGGALTVVNVHGTSGFNAEDMACRAEQFRQVFEDRGDGVPAANGMQNVVLGDLNTDPFIYATSDESAAYWDSQVGPDKRFHFITDNSRRAPRSYIGLANIDHVVSDTLAGTCVVAGVSPGVPAMAHITYWDHNPAVCQAWFPSP